MWKKRHEEEHLHKHVLLSRRTVSKVCYKFAISFLHKGLSLLKKHFLSWYTNDSWQDMQEAIRLQLPPGRFEKDADIRGYALVTLQPAVLPLQTSHSTENRRQFQSMLLAGGVRRRAEERGGRWDVLLAPFFLILILCSSCLSLPHFLLSVTPS